jgi:hypothetical protein
MLVVSREEDHEIVDSHYKRKLSKLVTEAAAMQSLENMAGNESISPALSHSYGGAMAMFDTSRCTVWGYVNIHMYTHIQMHTYSEAYTHVHRYTHAHRYRHVHRYTHIDICIFAHTHILIYTYIYVRTIGIKKKNNEGGGASRYTGHFIARSNTHLATSTESQAVHAQIVAASAAAEILKQEAAKRKMSALAATDAIIRQGLVSNPRPELNGCNAKAWLKWMARKMSECAENDLEKESLEAAKLKKLEGLEDALWVLAPKMFCVWTLLQSSTTASASSSTPSTTVALTTILAPPPPPTYNNNNNNNSNSNSNNNNYINSNNNYNSSSKFDSALSALCAVALYAPPTTTTTITATSTTATEQALT